MVNQKPTNYYTLYNGDAIEQMKLLSDNSVDFICVDLPYGTTQNKWDTIIPFEPLWEQFNRVGKETAAMVFTATQPFTAKIVMSNLDNFKYDLIWEKTISSGQLNVSHMPMRNHESILVFYRKKPTYNEQKTIGKPYTINRKGEYKEGNYGEQKATKKENTGYRHAKSVIKISNPRIKNGHPTQKPVELMEYLIKMFTNEGDTVLDCCMGAGTTGEAALNLKRKFIGIELDTSYFISSQERLEKCSE